MPDQGKLAALAGASYRVQRACVTCEHFASASPGWGRCHRLPHVHAEHGAKASTGVMSCGVCPAHVFAPSVMEGLISTGYAQFLPLDLRPRDVHAEDRALVKRLQAIDDGLSEWEVGFVDSLSRWVETKELTKAQRERALQIDER